MLCALPRVDVGEAGVLELVDAVAPHLQPRPAMVALLERLHAAGVPLHYLSNMPGPLADALEREHGRMRCFRSGVFSSRVHARLIRDR